MLRPSRRAFSVNTKAFADVGFAGQKPAMATSIIVEIVHKPKDQIGFAAHSCRLTSLLTAALREADHPPADD